MDQVGEFCYLGTIISADGTCSTAIGDRIRKAWTRLHLNHYIWRQRGLTRKARATFFRCIVLTTLFHGCERWTPSKADMTKLRKNHHNMLAKALNIPHWRRSRVPRAQLRHLMDDISDVDSYLEMRMLRYTGHLMRRQDDGRSAGHGGFPLPRYTERLSARAAAVGTTAWSDPAGTTATQAKNTRALWEGLSLRRGVYASAGRV